MVINGRMEKLTVQRVEQGNGRVYSVRGEKYGSYVLEDPGQGGWSTAPRWFATKGEAEAFVAGYELALKDVTFFLPQEVEV